MDANDSNTKECDICYESFSLTDVFNISKECTHESKLCKPCIQKHMEAEVNTKGEVMTIKCPISDCRKVLNHEEIRLFATKAVFDRYDTLLLRKAIQALPNFRWCKNSECGSGQEHVGGHQFQIMTCHMCRSKSCFTHDVPWHTSRSCAEYDRDLDQTDVAAMQHYVNRRTKPCPICSMRIEKNGGCDHMTCRRPAGCGHEFCWLCLADYHAILTHGNHKHKPTCQYYAPYNPDESDVSDDDDESGSDGSDGSDDDHDVIDVDDESGNDGSVSDVQINEVINVE
eukprot:TRINITY_DN11846_c0_g1::TRINITY_DN11846_c0_g1_i1::g.16418::m.16418 TRINITY_DN11846_c0_g1::TRINITY_DN11846_c0_g1_i1::g.16418  ORF type:complete len:284 (+),score=29.45,sp/Q6T486/RBRA_DICDI/29.71/4e-25,IBR/PF01485.16/4e+03,IBR/PF01485.16/1.1e+02,IBR/PF01485.16/2e-11,IBR/PF01485.16/2.2e-09,IBR/PF01485.16/4.4e+03,zf-C3HC4_2/PF13923.1/0.004,zf-C3HC4_2/PF13923.1/5.1e+03,zf-C3HC4_2/PF13923.1/1.5e+02,zf-C3HC4_2/PF13923.1/1.1e+03,Baculo_RING/PF05883.6/9.1,Baculo_RING/PF05883.6/0.026,zf-C3HC4/PF00097.20/0.